MTSCYSFTCCCNKTTLFKDHVYTDTMYHSHVNTKYHCSVKWYTSKNTKCYTEHISTVTMFHFSVTLCDKTSRCYISLKHFALHCNIRLYSWTKHDLQWAGKEMKQMLVNLRCISCPYGWKALRFLDWWAELSQRFPQASCLEVDRSFLTIRWCKVVIRKC